MATGKHIYSDNAKAFKRSKIKILLNQSLIFLTITSSIVYIAWRTFFTLPFEYGVVAIILGVFLLVVEIVGMFEAAVHFYSMTNIISPERPKVDESIFPDVDIFIATYNEPVELLYKTINGCIHMDYPDKSKIHVYVCDDGNRQEVKELTEKMNVTHVTRPEHTHAKAGNLNNAMTVSSSPLILTLDADMIPMSNFLVSCVPYFLTEEKIGFVQTPQSFYNLDLYQYYLYSEDRIPNEQDYFYKTVQTSRNKINSVIYGGSNTIILREALMEIGGFVTNVITEDFATGIAIQSRGYKCIALEHVYASGLSPEDLKSLIKQRERWARGCIQSGRQLNILFRKGLNLRQKFSYMSSITYWYSSFKRLSYIISPIAFSVFGVVVVRCTFLELFFFWLPMFILNKISIKRLSGNIRSAKWSNVYETILFPALLPTVLIETFGLTKTTFAVTRKDGRIENDIQYQIKQAMPHVFFGILTFIGIVRSIQYIFKTGVINYLYMVFWLSINFYNILMSIFFMIGRKNYPELKKADISIECTLKLFQSKFKCQTDYVSEKEFGITIDMPKYFKKDANIEVTLNSGKYTSNFKATILTADKIGKKFIYTFRISEIEELENRELLQIIYDRVPTTTQTMEEDSSTFDDIRINIIKRIKPEKIKPERIKRSSSTLPEISVKREYTTAEGQTIQLFNFYYEYLSVKRISEGLPIDFEIHFDNRISLECSFDKVGTNGTVLYTITNYQQIANSIELDEIIAQWLDGSAINLAINQLPSTSGYKLSEADEFDEMAYL